MVSRAAFQGVRAAIDRLACVADSPYPARGSKPSSVFGGSYPRCLHRGGLVSRRGRWLRERLGGHVGGGGSAVTPIFGTVVVRSCFVGGVCTTVTGAVPFGACFLYEWTHTRHRSYRRPAFKPQPCLDTPRTELLEAFTALEVWRTIGTYLLQLS